jgi:hypothetical protein
MPRVQLGRTDGRTNTGWNDRRLDNINVNGSRPSPTAAGIVPPSTFLSSGTNPTDGVSCFLRGNKRSLHFVLRDEDDSDRLPSDVYPRPLPDTAHVTRYIGCGRTMVGKSSAGNHLCDQSNPCTQNATTCYHWIIVRFLSDCVHVNCYVGQIIHADVRSAWI